MKHRAKNKLSILSKAEIKDFIVRYPRFLLSKLASKKKKQVPGPLR